MVKKLIEIWKNDCEHCKAVKPALEQLEKEGYEFARYNAEEAKGQDVMADYVNEIDARSKKMGYEQGMLYTPTFVNPQTKKVLFYSDKAPTKEEISKLAD